MFTTSETLKQVFKIEFSTKGSNLRSREEQAYVFFCDFLDECDEGMHSDS